MATTEKPTYIVAELPSELAHWVQEIRQRFEPTIAHMPAEITLAGSSSVGPLLEQQPLTDVALEIERVTQGKTDFSFRLLGVGTFEGTDIFFAEPEHEGFNILHSALRSSNLEFQNSPHPYHPHCSLKGFTPLELGQREALEALNVPRGMFQIERISVYEIDEMKPRKLLSISSTER